MSEEETVHGHVMAYYTDASGQTKRRSVRVLLPVSTLAHDLKTRSYEADIRAKLDADGFTVVWLAPWRVGSHTEARNPVEWRVHVEAEVVPLTGEDRDQQKIVFSSKVNDIEYWVWNRHEFEKHVLDTAKAKFRVVSIGPMALGPYISAATPIEHLETVQ